MTTICKFFVAALLLLPLAACSGDDDELFQDGSALGPKTEQKLKTLPEGLLADTANSRHSTETLEPK